MSTVHHKFAIPYSDMNSFVQDYSHKLESSGLSLKTTKLVVVGQRVALHFRFQDGTPEVIGVGDVAWVDTNAEPVTGKVSFLIRNLRLDDNSRTRVTQYLQSGAAETSEEVEEVVPGHFNQAPAAPVQPQTAQVRPAAQSVAPPPAEQPAMERPRTKPAAGSSDGSSRKKKIIIAVIILLLLAGSSLGWLFGLGGMEFVFSRFVKAPPAPANPPAMVRSVQGVEPALPAFRAMAVPKPKPKPKPRPAAMLHDLDLVPLVASGSNQFVLYFRSRPSFVRGRIEGSPPRYEMEFGHARMDLEKEQWFLPRAFALVRTLQFEQDGDILLATFLAKQSYVPRVVYEWKENELTVKFVASD